MVNSIKDFCMDTVRRNIIDCVSSACRNDCK
jgi:hypothetical protein